MRTRLPASFLVFVMLIGCLSSPRGLDVSKDRVRAYLLPEPYRTLEIRMDAVPGSGPTLFTLESLKDEISNATGKRVELASVVDLPTNGGDTKKWTLAEVIALAQRTETGMPDGAFGHASVGVVHVLFLDGELTLDDGTQPLGIAFGRAAALFFGANRPPAFQLLARPSTSEIMQRAIMIHEVGHQLGLVDDGVPMVRPHNDPKSPHHSANPESVMVSGLDFGKVPSGLIDPSAGPPFRFDEDDLLDLSTFVAHERTS